MMDEDIKKLIAENKKLLEKNLTLTQEIQRKTRYIKRYVVVSQVMGVIKLLLIAIPVILGILYLPSLLDGLFNQYKSLLNFNSGQAGQTIDLNQVDLNGLPPELMRLINP